MEFEMSPKTKNCIFLLLIAVWPFIFLSNYVFGAVSVGNNFYYVHYNYKAYELAAWYSGFYPLWLPSDAAGSPLFGTPFASAVYPLNLLYLAAYAIGGGFTGWDYTLFTILAFSIFGAGLYLWLRQHSVSASVAFASVLITLMSLKLVELLRDPTAAHTAAWMPWLLYGIALATNKFQMRTGALIFAGSAFMLLTAGYPYFVIYTPFLVGPYLIAMALPSRKILLGHDQVRPASATALIAAIGVAFSAAAMLAMPWLLHVRGTLAQTSDREIPNFEFATANSSNLTDTIGSWIFPPAANMEGWYYFGIVTTLLILLYLACLFCGARDKARERKQALLILPWMAIIAYITWGKDSVLFTWLWGNVPVFNQLRFWSRLNVILLPMIALLLSGALTYYLHLVHITRDGWKPEAKRGIVILIAITATVLVGQAFFLIKGEQIWSHYWQGHFKLGYTPVEATPGWIFALKRAFDERYFVLMSGIGGALLVAIHVMAKRHPKLVTEPAILLLIVAVSFIDLYPISTTQWITPFKDQKREHISITDELRKNFERPRDLSEWPVLFPFERTHKAGVIESWDLQRHRTFFLKTFLHTGEPNPAAPAEEVAAVRRLLGADQRAQRLFLSGRVDYATAVDFMSDVDRTGQTPQSIRVVYYDGDILRLQVNASQSGWLSFIDNWTPDWTATVNDQPVQIAPLFGSYKSIPVPPGESSVEFRYQLGLFPKSPPKARQ